MNTERPLPGRIPRILETPLSTICELMRRQTIDISAEEKDVLLTSSFISAKNFFEPARYVDCKLTHSRLRQLVYCDDCGVVIIHIAIRTTVDGNGNMHHVYVRNMHPF